jgi:hypothetical protein
MKDVGGRVFFINVADYLVSHTNDTGQITAY